MSRIRTWKVVEMGEGFHAESVIELGCPGCGRDAEMPYWPWKDNPVIAACGLAVIFDRPWLGDPPHEILPETVQCRKCRRSYTRKKVVELESEDAPERSQPVAQ